MIMKRISPVLHVVLVPGTWYLYCIGTVHLDVDLLAQRIDAMMLSIGTVAIFSTVMMGLALLAIESLIEKGHFI